MKIEVDFLFGQAVFFCFFLAVHFLVYIQELEIIINSLLKFYFMDLDVLCSGRSHATGQLQDCRS